MHSNLAAPERSVFVTPGGETRLFGFEASHSLDYSKSTISTESQHCANPDIHSDFWEEDHLPRSTVIRGNENETSIDVYMLGKMIIEIFKSYTGSILGISNSLQEICQQCNTSSVFLLPKLQACVEYESSMGGVGDLISLSKRLDSLTLMTNHEERAMLLSALATRRDEITSLVSKIYLRNKALPILGNLFSFIPSAISDDAVRLFLSISNACCGDEKTSTSEKTSKKLNLPSVIEKIIIILFETNDKSIRIALLESFPISILMELKDRTIQEKVYPPLSTGFTDVLPAIRHLTLKASVSLIEKFSSRQINGEIVKFYFRLQTDDQPGIRVNAMVCIAKVAKHLAPATATSLLCGAIVRALKDAFTPSRKSALLAAASFVDIVPIPDLASAFLPAICPALIDQALEVRVQAFKTISIILEKVEKYSSEIVDVIDRSPAPTGQYSISERLTTLVIGSKESVVSDPNLKNSLQNDRNNDFKPNEIENFDESNALPQNSNEFYVGIQQKKQILNDPAAIYHSTSSSRMTVNSSSHPSGFMLYKNISNVKKGSKTQFTASSATEYSPEKYHVNNPPQSQSSVEHVNNFSNQSKQLSGGLLNQRADESKTTVNRSASKPMQLKAVRTKNTDF